jgi:lactate dehydrogenase-like 2-hydroxyacid dehydrogenase
MPRAVDLVWVWGSSVLTGNRLDALPRCGAILRSGSGTDNIPVSEATKYRMVVINTPGAVTHEVADHATALLLSGVRQISAQDRLMRSGTWEFRRENNRWHLTDCAGWLYVRRLPQLICLERGIAPAFCRILGNSPLD